MTHLKIGDKAPSFSGVSQDGENISLSDFKGKKLVLFFYPRANTPGCTSQACNLNDNYEKLKQEGYQVLGVSADTQQKQSNFKAKNHLEFSLIADINKEIIESYGVWGPKKFMGREYKGIHRITFLIDEEGIIENIIEKVKTKEHITQILA